MRNTLFSVAAILSLAVASLGQVSVASPSAGSTVSSSVHVKGSASMSGTVTTMQAYVDNTKVAQVSGNSIDTYISLGAGTHSLVLQSWNSSGSYAKSSAIKFSVSSSSGVTVTSPASGATTTSSVAVKGTASMSGSVTTMQVYVDGTKLYQVSGSAVNTTLSGLKTGSHKLVMQSWNNYGQYAKSSPVSFTVGSTSTSTSSGGSTATAPSGSRVYANVDQMSGWQNCGACAGEGGNGSVVPYSMTQYQSSPAMDGSAAQFWIGSGTPYSDALWWKQLGANSGVSHFIYDLYFYYTDASAPQSLEFDLNQSVGGYKYIFGTQCSVHGDKSWDIWDNVNVRWVSTGIACPAPPTYQWNHLTWEFERVNGKLHFIAVTLNGVKRYVDKYYAPRASGASELNVAFQMDGNYAGKSYKVWLDKVNLTAW